MTTSCWHLKGWVKFHDSVIFVALFKQWYRRKSCSVVHVNLVWSNLTWWINLEKICCRFLQTVWEKVMFMFSIVKEAFDPRHPGCCDKWNCWLLANYLLERCKIFGLIAWNKVGITSGSRIWSRGGARIFCRNFADVAKRSRASEASQYWPGSRARLRALEALAFLTLKYAFSHFSWYFFFKFLMYISVGALTNIYFSMKDSDNLDKCNFPFLYLRKSEVFISSFGLLCKCIAL